MKPTNKKIINEGLFRLEIQKIRALINNSKNKDSLLIQFDNEIKEFLEEK